MEGNAYAEMLEQKNGASTYFQCIELEQKVVHEQELINKKIN
jgi:hypothetical protein